MSPAAVDGALLDPSLVCRGPSRTCHSHPVTIRLSAAEARSYLVSHLGLARRRARGGAAASRAVLGALRAIQLDPLEPIAANAELVLLARVSGARRGELFDHLMPGHAFEHFAKERCLLPASAFPYYRDQAVETPWWRTSERMKRIDRGLIEAVLAEVEARGPVLPGELTDHGKVKPIDWAGWRGTSSAATMALEVLWTQCRVVVAGRIAGKKRYDVPRRALPHVHDAAISEPFERWAIRERAAAAGLLTRNAGPQWSMLSTARNGPSVDALVEDGVLDEVTVEGSSARYLAPREALASKRTAPDDVMRVLGPLDPLVWDRGLVKAAFGFEYLWEVYKPAHQRRWGWYVCPLLHRGRLVGRIEAKRDVRRGKAILRVSKVWREANDFDEDALTVLLDELADALSVTAVVLERAARRR